MLLNEHGPAPGRGHYNRSQDRAQRRLGQRERLAAATCVVLAEVGAEGTTVDRIVRRAKVGRGTFYEHFRDVTEAIEVATNAAADALFGALDQTPGDARTPLERMRR